MSIYGTAGQGTYSVSYSNVDLMLSDLADNNSNAIHAQQIRNTVWTLWNRSSVNKYGATHSFLTGISATFSHNLNTPFYTIQTFETNSGQEILGAISSRGTYSVTITFSDNVPNCSVVIVG